MQTVAPTLGLPFGTKQCYIKFLGIEKLLITSIRSIKDAWLYVIVFKEVYRFVEPWMDSNVLFRGLNPSILGNTRTRDIRQTLFESPDWTSLHCLDPLAMNASMRHASRAPGLHHQYLFRITCSENSKF